jgi:hypothetical protein
VRTVDDPKREYRYELGSPLGAENWPAETAGLRLFRLRIWVILARDTIPAAPAPPDLQRPGCESTHQTQSPELTYPRFKLLPG